MTTLDKAKRLREIHRMGEDWGDLALQDGPEIAAHFVRAVELLRGEHRHSDIGHREPTELCPTCTYLRDVGAEE